MGASLHQFGNLEVPGILGAELPSELCPPCPGCASLLSTALRWIQLFSESLPWSQPPSQHGQGSSGCPVPALGDPLTASIPVRALCLILWLREGWSRDRAMWAQQQQGSGSVQAPE